MFMFIIDCFDLTSFAVDCTVSQILLVMWRVFHCNTTFWGGLGIKCQVSYQSRIIQTGFPYLHISNKAIQFHNTKEKLTVMNLKQNEAQSVSAESTHKGVN